jgi:hypothetical protein
MIKPKAILPETLTTWNKFVAGLPSTVFGGDL